jgi:hypothetical protein
LERRPAKICRINTLFRKKLPCPWGFTPAEPQDVVLKKVGPQIASRGVNQALTGPKSGPHNDFPEK